MSALERLIGDLAAERIRESVEPLARDLAVLQQSMRTLTTRVDQALLALQRLDEAMQGGANGGEVGVGPQVDGLKAVVARLGGLVEQMSVVQMQHRDQIDRAAAEVSRNAARLTAIEQLSGTDSRPVDSDPDQG